jgi:hypothetical protein
VENKTADVIQETRKLQIMQRGNYSKAPLLREKMVSVIAAAAAFPSLSCFYGSVNPRSTRHELRSLSKPLQIVKL